jgi:glucose/arabinose dehydrogenase
VPKGFKVEVYASGMPNARSLALGDKGTVFVGSRLQDKVYAIVDKGGKREVKIIASGLYRPNGVAFKNGTLYIMELSQLSKIDKIEDNLDNPPKPTVILSGLPKDEAHGWKYLAIGPDNKLYFEIGQPCNNCLPPEGYGTMRRVNLDGTAWRRSRRASATRWASTGIRRRRKCTSPTTAATGCRRIFPNDELNRMTKVGQHFGSPFCYQGNLPDQEFGWGRKCERVRPADRADGAARGRARHEVLYRQLVPGEVPQPDPGGAPRVLEQDQQDRRRRRSREHQEGRQRGTDRAVPHRLSREQQLCRAAGRRDGHEGWLDLVSDDWNGAVWRVSYGNARTAAPAEAFAARAVSALASRLLL